MQAVSHGEVLFCEWAAKRNAMVVVGDCIGDTISLRLASCGVRTLYSCKRLYLHEPLAFER